MRSKLFFLAAGGVVIVLVSILWIFDAKGATEDEVVATVNGEPITSKHFQQRMLVHRGQVQSYFYKTYGVGDSADFWTTEHHSEIPIEMVRKRTLDELTRIKIQQIMAKEKGIVGDISYDGFLRQMEEANRKRQQTAGKGVIYGPVNYNEHTYFEYVFSNMVIRLKQKMAGEGLMSGRGDFAAMDREYERRIDEILKKATVVVNESVYLQMVFARLH